MYDQLNSAFSHVHRWKVFDRSILIKFCIFSCVVHCAEGVSGECNRAGQPTVNSAECAIRGGKATLIEAEQKLLLKVHLLLAFGKNPVALSFLWKH